MIAWCEQGERLYYWEKKGRVQYANTSIYEKVEAIKVECLNLSALSRLSNIYVLFLSVQIEVALNLLN